MMQETALYDQIDNYGRALNMIEMSVSKQNLCELFSKRQGILLLTQFILFLISLIQLFSVLIQLFSVFMLLFSVFMLLFSVFMLLFTVFMLLFTVFMLLFSVFAVKYQLTLLPDWKIFTDMIFCNTVNFNAKFGTALGNLQKLSMAKKQVLRL